MEHSKEIELFCLDCGKLICVKCLISEGHQIHKIEDINSAFKFLSSRFKNNFLEFKDSKLDLETSLIKMKKESEEQKINYERYKSKLKQIYQELKNSLKNKRNQMARAGERILKENSAKLKAYSKEIEIFQTDSRRWEKMNAFLNENEQFDEEDMFYFLDKYTEKMETFQEDHVKLSEMTQESSSCFMKKMKPVDCKENLKLSLLGMVKKAIISQVSHKNMKGQIYDIGENQSISSKITSKKLKNLIRKSELKSKKRKHLNKILAEKKQLPFKYVSNTLMMDSMSIQKNLKNLRKDLTGEQFRQNYMKINPKSGKPVSGGIHMKHPLQRMKQTSYQKSSRLPAKTSKAPDSSISKFVSGNRNKRVSKKLSWKHVNISSSRSQQHLLTSPISRTGGNKQSKINLRSNSHQKKMGQANASIDTKIKANSKVEFYRPKMDISKKHANLEYEVIGGEHQQIYSIPKKQVSKFENDDFALSIHGNEEISLKSLKSKHWKKPPF